MSTVRPMGVDGGSKLEGWYEGDQGLAFSWLNGWCEGGLGQQRNDGGGCTTMRERS